MLGACLLLCAAACTCDSEQAARGATGGSRQPPAATSGSNASRPSSESCPRFATGVRLGDVADNAIDEASGLAASRHNDDVLWVHNDSGDIARLFAIRPSGRLLGIYVLDGAGAIDWEDIALGPGPSKDHDYLYLGDIGDNDRKRSHVVVYRVLEPDVPAAPRPTPKKLEGVEAFRLVYPDGAHDCETLLVDPVRDRLFLVTREKEGPSRVYEAPSPLSSKEDDLLEAKLPLPFGKPPLSGSHLVTGGDVSPDGRYILIKTYTSAYIWPRHEGESLDQALSAAPCPAPVAVEPQGEAIAFRPDGRGYFTVSEKTHQPVYFFARQSPLRPPGR